MPSGKAPSSGEVFRNPDMAGVLRELGTGGKEAFYGGRIGEAMVEVLREMGGVLTVDDLKARAKNKSMFFSHGCGCVCGRRSKFRLALLRTAVQRKDRHRVHACRNPIGSILAEIQL